MPSERPRREVSPELLARCHANTLEDYRVFARSTEGGGIEEYPGVLLVCTGGRDSLENLAIVTEPPIEPQQVLDRAVSFFGRHRCPWAVLVFPEAVTSMQRVLSLASFQDEGEFPGMVITPIAARTPAPPDGYRVVRAQTLDELARLEHVASKAYGVPYGTPTRAGCAIRGFRSTWGTIKTSQWRTEPSSSRTLWRASRTSAPYPSTDVEASPRASYGRSSGTVTPRGATQPTFGRPLSAGPSMPRWGLRRSWITASGARPALRCRRPSAADDLGGRASEYVGSVTGEPAVTAGRGWVVRRSPFPNQGLGHEGQMGGRVDGVPAGSQDRVEIADERSGRQGEPPP